MSTPANPLAAGVPALTPPSPTQTMIAPDGSTGEVPVENVQAAVKAGGKVGMRMTAPDGSTGVVPVENAHDAIAAGGKPLGNTGKGMDFNMPAAAARSFDVPQVIDAAKQSWAAGQPQRDAEAKVVKDSIEAIKRGDYGTAADNLITHMASGAYNTTKNQLQQGGTDLVSTVKGIGSNIKENLTGGNEPPFDPAHPERSKVLGAPIIPGPAGLEGLVEDFAAAEPEAEAAASSSSVLDRVKQAVSPSAATQPGAQSTLRTGAQASATDAGVTAEASNGGIRTLMEKPIAAAAKAETGLYKTLNDAAETDMKDLFDRREELLDALDDPTNVANRKALANELSITEKAIKVHSDLVTDKLGAEAPKLLEQAKAATQQRYAMENVDAKIFNNEGVVSGDVEHGIPEQINVDSAIRNAQNLDKASKFAPRGTPTRLQQAFGEEGAKALKQGLYDAQKAGQKVATRNSVLGWIAKGGGALAGYEVLSH